MKGGLVNFPERMGKPSLDNVDNRHESIECILDHAVHPALIPLVESRSVRTTFASGFASIKSSEQATTGVSEETAP
ncbi:uncharacterized protein N7503_009394 [Penicillium pulvis]|uniref:uncharacterized protein n=1 Tax=Penicillium pulvis TaxID=1562058 RepID=UPI0025494274|nr:uncharacterized protein N7503_009394 [Penicillium pulvis]KAJ5784182.1 hypothetical protein N7503_009394 [Penicillium pulvis]